MGRVGHVGMVAAGRAAGHCADGDRQSAGGGLAGAVALMNEIGGPQAAPEAPAGAAETCVLGVYPPCNLAPGGNAGGSFGKRERHTSIWTDAEKDFLRDAWPDIAWSRAQIQEKLNRRMGAIERMASKMGLGWRPFVRTIKQVSAVSWRTDERRKILDREWPAGTPTPEIFEMMQRQPGPPVPKASLIGLWANDCGVRRPTRKVETVKRERGERNIALPPLTTPQPVIDRRCLSCRDPFLAETRFLRMCPDCRTGRRMAA